MANETTSKSPGIFRSKMNISTNCLPIVILFLVFCTIPAHADDGYRLWLKYDRVEDTLLNEQYQNVITGLHMPGSSQNMVVARNELVRGLSGLLGTDVALLDTMGKNGIVIAGTPATIPSISELVSSDELAELGTEGFLIRSVPKNGRDIMLIAAATDRGVMYGAFYLLRLLQSDIASRTSISFQCRAYNYASSITGIISTFC